MRRIILFNMLSADGSFKGEEEDISWHRVDEEVNEFIIEQLQSGDTLLFGRRTFEVMENFWPTEQAIEQDPEVAGMMSDYVKLVFSTTREKTTWKNTQFFREVTIGAIQKLKGQQGKNIFVFGSAHLCKVLIKNNLIDEFRLMINPVTLGNGEPLFYTKMNLQLLRTKVFGNGNVLLCYRQDN